MRRYIAMILAVLVILGSFAACGKSSSPESATSEKKEEQAIEESSMKIGFILPAEDGALDTKARTDAIRKMQIALEVDDDQITVKDNISKEKCAETLEKMVSDGCQLIFACGSRYEEAVLEAAQQNSDVHFCVEGGRETIDSTLANVHTYNSRMFEAYYIEGIAAGMKLNAMLNAGDIVPDTCNVGYVAYKDCAETNTCINAFYRGLCQVCTQAEIYVRYVGKRGDYDADGEAARQLVAQGAKMMCTYTYTTAAATVCSENGIPVFGNEENVINVAPKKAITSAYTDWSVYYTEAIQDLIEGKEIPHDWVGGYKEGAVRLTQLNDHYLTSGTTERIMEAESDMRSGKIKVFTLDKFTINDATLDTLANSVSDFGFYKSSIKDGELKEQSVSSTPIFKDLIDGIVVSTYDYLGNNDSDEAVLKGKNNSH